MTVTFANLAGLAGCTFDVSGLLSHPRSSDVGRSSFHEVVSPGKRHDIMIQTVDHIYLTGEAADPDIQGQSFGVLRCKQVDPPCGEEKNSHKGPGGKGHKDS